MNKKVLLFLSQGFEAYEAAVFTDVFGWSKECGTQPVTLLSCGLRNEIRCTWNFIVKPELNFDEIKHGDFDALAIPGGFDTADFYSDAFDEKFLQLIRDFDNSKKPIASVCVGSLSLGKAGILNNRKATSWKGNNGHRRKQLAGYGAILVDKDVVIDDNIITSSGPATGISVALKLLEMLSGKENRDLVAKEMGF